VDWVRTLAVIDVLDERERILNKKETLIEKRSTAPGESDLKCKCCAIC